MDAMEVVNDKVASGDLTAKCLEADYATLVETRGSQNRTPKIEEPSSKGQYQATEDLESKFQVLANAAGCLPGEPRYKRLLRKFLTAVYATNAQKYCSNARNAKDKNKTSSTKIMSQGTNHCPPAVGSSQKSDDESATMTSLRHKLAAARLDGDVSESASQMPAPEARFQELVPSLGLTKGSKRYKIHRRQFFKYESSRDYILKSGDDIAIEKLERFEESCAARGLQQGSKEFRIFKRNFDIENEDDSETSSDSSFSLCGFTSADDDSQYALQFKGRLHTTKGNNLHDGKPSDGEVTNSQRSNKKQPKRGRNRAHKDSAQNESSQKDSPPKDGAQKGVAKKGSSQKDRAQRAKEEFKAYFPDPHKLANWQKLCRDLKIDPVPSSITQCKKVSGFWHFVRTFFLVCFLMHNRK